MRIGKFYNSEEKAYGAFKRFVDMNRYHVQEADYNGMQVVLINGVIVQFMRISSFNEVNRAAGYEFSVIELDDNSYFDMDTIYYLKTRLRCKEMVI